MLSGLLKGLAQAIAKSLNKQSIVSSINDRTPINLKLKELTNDNNIVVKHITKICSLIYVFTGKMCNYSITYYCNYYMSTSNKVTNA